MGILRNIPFENESPEIKHRVTDYWSERADGFFEQRRDELHSEKAAQWLSELKPYLPEGRKLRILDIGCGAGFFEVLLGRLGHTVIGIDLTPEMVRKARELIVLYGLEAGKVSSLTMDAEAPDFPDGFFDLIISRNLTWTLPHPVDAYRQWYRVLKHGGVMLNFDAEYAKGAHNLKQPENIAHRAISDDLKDECHEIYHMLSISALDRPQWDVEVLKSVGFTNVKADTGFGDRVYAAQDAFYMPDRMFMISAEKE